MLDRIVQETVSIDKTREDIAASWAGKKHGGTLRRMTGTLGKVPAVPHTEQASTALARIFAPAIFPPAATTNKKPSTAQEKRKTDLLEIFLRREPG